jgi:hypothetical protein
MPGARCTRGLACKGRKKCAHEHTGTVGTLRHSLRNGFTAYAVLSRRRIRLVTVASGLRLIETRSGSKSLRRLDTSNGCQDHTVLPYASAPFVLRAVSAHGQTALRTLLAPDATASTASHPASVTIAKRPSLGWDGPNNSDDLPDGQNGIFFAVELDNPNQLEMSRKFSLCEHGGKGCQP